MEISFRHGPSFSVARCMLAPFEVIQAESGAMMAMSPTVQLSARAEGGVLKSLKRAALGGESLFVSTYTAPAEGGFVDLAARLPGDLTWYAMTEAMPLFIAKGGWLANAATVQLDTQWGGFKNLFGSEGGFLIRATGHGPVIFACYGALEEWTLGPGHRVTVDSGHMVAYEGSISVNLRKAAGGVIQSFKSGEGLVFDFEGPGKVWVQTRNPNELLGWIAAALPSNSAGPVTFSGGFSRS